MPEATSFTAVHLERSGDFTLPMSLKDAFPFFTPEGERRWVPGWEPEYLHPSGPSTEPGTVFQTTHGGERTIWLILASMRGPGRPHTGGLPRTRGSGLSAWH